MWLLLEFFKCFEAMYVDLIEEERNLFDIFPSSSLSLMADNLLLNVFLITTF